jgi:hypothetical protein
LHQILIPLTPADSLPVLLLSIVLNQTLWVKRKHQSLIFRFLVILSFPLLSLIVSRQAYFHVCGTSVLAHLHIDVDEIMEYVWQQGTNRAIPVAGRVSSIGTCKKIRIGTINGHASHVFTAHGFATTFLEPIIFPLF